MAKTNSDILEEVLDNTTNEAYQKIINTVKLMEEDMVKFVVKNNTSAGKRLRKYAQDLKTDAQLLRVSVMATIKAE